MRNVIHIIPQYDYNTTFKEKDFDIIIYYVLTEVITYHRFLFACTGKL